MSFVPTDPSMACITAPTTCPLSVNAPIAGGIQSTLNASNCTNAITKDNQLKKTKKKVHLPNQYNNKTILLRRTVFAPGSHIANNKYGGAVDGIDRMENAFFLQ
jgi:hypothetical protein